MSAIGIISSSTYHVQVEGMQQFRPISAFSYLGRYRIIDFTLSNMSNSGIDRIYLFAGRHPRSLAEHVGIGRPFNINSKHGKLQLLFSNPDYTNEIYNTDIADFRNNLEIIQRAPQEYVVLAPGYYIYAEDYEQDLQKHIESGADISILYHRTENGREEYLNTNVLNLNRQKGVESIDRNLGTAKEKYISMNTYYMKKSVFVDLVKESTKLSSMFTLSQVVNAKCGELDVRGIPHRGFFGAINSLRAYYDANMAMLNLDTAHDLFKSDWPIYTRTTDSSPTTYATGAHVTHSRVSNGCMIEGNVSGSIIGRGVKIGKGSTIKDSIILAYSTIGDNVHIENQIVDKWVSIEHENEIIAPEGKIGYIKRNDIL